MIGSDYYKLMFAYKTADIEKDGKVVLKKQEFLAQCVNFTEAEKLVMQLISDYNMNELEESSYDIKKMPKISNIIFNGHFGVDENSYHNMVELFFDDRDEHLYQVDMQLGSGDKPMKDTIYIPAISTNEAVVKALNLYKETSLDAKVLKTGVMELIDAVFVFPETYEKMHNRFTKE